MIVADSGWTIAAAWVGAIAAGAAFLVTALALRTERQARHAAEERAARQHARLLQVTFRGAPISWSEDDPTSDIAWGWKPTVENKSAEMFDDVELHVDIAGGARHDWTIGTLAAGAVASKWLRHKPVGSDSDDGMYDIDSSSAIFVIEDPVERPRGELRYADEAGTRWVRDIVTSAVNRISP